MSLMTRVKTIKMKNMWFDYCHCRVRTCLKQFETLICILFLLSYLCDFEQITNCSCDSMIFLPISNVSVIIFPQGYLMTITFRMSKFRLYHQIFSLNNEHDRATQRERDRENNQIQGEIYHWYRLFSLHNESLYIYLRQT